MLAIELIVDAIPPLSTSDTIQQALDRMAEFKVRHLPIVNDDQYLGLLAEEELTDPNHETLLSSLPLTLTVPYVLEAQHIYEVISALYQRQISVIPVLSVNKTYMGVITVNAMVNGIAQLTSATEPGVIIVLEITNKNNSLAHMAQIVESDNAQILSSYARTFPDSTRMEVTLKINKQDTSGISATFLRYGYDVKAVFGHTDDNDDTRDRYDSLMNYLNF
ncbi:CBS domain-containing protein [Mucilaginibacter jinjuensis]|uniref:CBS domain-containing protein n=1 Tax=Mucilaginibacter jinjuensis TaxID=1176721 RepID=A0ABY7TD04_9SPHI|nr:CBS domain-containing protein [Mucilaginibacter jinjuensis]WCT13945.1 CBS domain-containing protein [Mucilaginibacter jinjuensis]